MTSITAPGSAAGWRAFAALLMAFVLLGTSCVKKAAPPALSKARSTMPASNRGEGLNYFSVEGGGGGYDQAPASVNVALASARQSDTLDARKIIRNGSLDLLVNDVSQSIDKIGSIVTGVGGFVEKSTQTTNSGQGNVAVPLTGAPLRATVFLTAPCSSLFGVRLIATQEVHAGSAHAQGL